MIRSLPLILSVMLIAAPAFAQRANPQIDYSGFRKLTQTVETQRADRLIDFAQFKTRSAKPETLILDARSADAYARGHITGAVNLPFTDFTAESLAATIGSDANRPILIYCNNNFSNNKAPVMLKARPLALNIQTFINLVGYGYPNVWELNEVVDFNDPKVGWVES